MNKQISFKVKVSYTLKERTSVEENFIKHGFMHLFFSSRLAGTELLLHLQAFFTESITNGEAAN